MLQLDSDDLLDAPGESQSAFYEGPGVSVHAPSQAVAGGPKGQREGLGVSPRGFDKPAQGAVTKNQVGWSKWLGLPDRRRAAVRPACPQGQLVQSSPGSLSHQGILLWREG